MKNITERQGWEVELFPEENSNFLDSWIDEKVETEMKELPENDNKETREETRRRIINGLRSMRWSGRTRH